MPDLLPEVSYSRRPDRILVPVSAPIAVDTMSLASRAVALAVSLMPKVSGHTAATLRPVAGSGYFGIYFPDRTAWFLESGIRPFTMTSLAGKTIPMWIDDPTGVERRNNPKAKTRTTVDGRTQVLIFRRAARKGQRRTVRRKGPGGTSKVVTVPASYPGAAGRIVRREAAPPLTSPGKVAARIAARNVGVRWRHPGTTGRKYLNYAVTQTAWSAGLAPTEALLLDAVTFDLAVRG
jgi:hypothetical protein